MSSVESIAVIGLTTAVVGLITALVNIAVTKRVERKTAEIAHSVNSAATEARNRIAALQTEVDTLKANKAERQNEAALLTAAAAGTAAAVAAAVQPKP